eukprot:TRINITY_DN7180_c0_g1_i2.p3 TRINITY_DN7180_c0_g1~~TRINITY_DN7180_c0_g1_i2.p3  ORF type:complete len:151 (-),score=13.24 TRINITY_DN7180_c0_g1_i2:29-481(-)
MMLTKAGSAKAGSCPATLTSRSSRQLRTDASSGSLCRHASRAGAVATCANKDIALARIELESPVLDAGSPGFTYGDWWLQASTPSEANNFVGYDLSAFHETCQEESSRRRRTTLSTPFLQCMLGMIDSHNVRCSSTRDVPYAHPSVHLYT